MSCLVCRLQLRRGNRLRRQQSRRLLRTVPGPTATGRAPICGCAAETLQFLLVHIVFDSRAGSRCCLHSKGMFKKPNPSRCPLPLLSGAYVGYVLIVSGTVAQRTSNGTTRLTCRFQTMT